MEQLLIIVAVASPLLTVGAAWGGVRYGLNGMREGVKRIEATVTRIDGQVQTNRVEIAGLKAIDRIER